MAVKPRPWARLLAWQALDRVAQGERLEEALVQALVQAPPRIQDDPAGLDPRERALAWELAYGVCRWQGLLDHYLAAFSNKPLNKLSPEVLTLLRMGAYQILKLERIPDRAAVHATVEAASSLPRWKSGFVNAVLRSLARDRERIRLPERSRDPAAYLALTESHPGWLVARWLGELGEERAEALLKADNRPPGLCLRVNRLAATREEVLDRLGAAGLDPRPGEYAPQAVYVAGSSVALLEEILSGSGPAPFQAQAEAAQAVAPLAAPGPGMRVLDLCAGVGGKSLHLAELSGDRAEIVALDISAPRIEAGKRAVKKAGLSSIRFVQADALKIGLEELGGRPFDMVLIDAPCSGSGVLAGRPDLRWRLGPDSPARMARLQERLLSAGARLTGPGGVLVYATCSLFPEENRERVRAFLDRHPEFALEEAAPLLPGPLRPLIDREGFLSTSPGEHGLDGFFGARMVKSPKQPVEE